MIFWYFACCTSCLGNGERSIQMLLFIVSGAGAFVWLQMESDNNNIDNFAVTNPHP